MSLDPRETSERKKEDRKKRTKEMSEEFSHEERMTNVVASTEYTGGGKGQADLKNDKLETGGF
ncbi:hypothetical protein ACFSFY_10685 [Sporosarcina siberiensis]|uniref:Uncharacterized protein n=1 Tax=Sporosarcina siberiensis TaxID=1365606 RepID=A0ABW4SGJ2_9BACL